MSNRNTNTYSFHQWHCSCFRALVLLRKLACVRCLVSGSVNGLVCCSATCGLLYARTTWDNSECHGVEQKP